MSLLSTCTVCDRSVSLGSTNVFLTFYLFYFCFTLLCWGAELGFPPFVCSICSLSWIQARFSSLITVSQLTSIGVWGKKIAFGPLLSQGSRHAWSTQHTILQIPALIDFPQRSGNQSVLLYWNTTGPIFSVCVLVCGSLIKHNFIWENADDIH